LDEPPEAPEAEFDPQPLRPTAAAVTTVSTVARRPKRWRTGTIGTSLNS
jgi:hypothetical protein